MKLEVSLDTLLVHNTSPPMSYWPRWILLWRPPVALFTWLSGAISWLYKWGGSIEQDIDNGPPIHRISITEAVETGNFRARTILGVGTSSIVYLVDETKATKRFKSSNDLLNECTIYQILGTHPRLLSIYHIGVDCIVMNWMKNGDLARFIQSHPDIAQRHKHRWITQIAESFSLLHKYEISHCDSKLENFLLDENYDIKICDFASSHNCRAPSNDLAIQPLRYRRVINDFDETVFTPADDIFAFGSICYEIITGQPPYHELDDEIVRHKFVRGDFPSTEGLSYGVIMMDCWDGKLISFEAISSAIEREGA